MKAAPFDYHAPRSLAEAVGLLSGLDNARPLAGGQSLMPMLNFRIATPDHLVDLGRIPELVGIEEQGDRLVIGAMTTQRTIERSEAVARRCPLLAEALKHIGHQQTRNRGTIGGSLCHLDPSAELPLVASALDAELHAAGPKGARVIPFNEFPAGYLSSQLAPDEILTAIEFPCLPRGTGYAFEELARRPADFAIVAVAVAVAGDGTGKVREARIAVGGLDPNPVRMTEAEDAMTGLPMDSGAAQAARRIVAGWPASYEDEINPAEYRQHLAGVLTFRAVTKALERAGAKADG